MPLSRVATVEGERRRLKELLEEISTMACVVADDSRKEKERRKRDNEFQ